MKSEKLKVIEELQQLIEKTDKKDKDIRISDTIN